MKKTMITIMILFISVAFLEGCTERTNPEPIPVGEEIVKIRVTAPLTGKFAYYGTQVQQALSLALEDNANALKDSGIKVDVKYVDNIGDKTTAITNFNMFVSEGGVPIIISTNTPLSQPLIPLAEQNKINLLALVTGAKDFAKDTNYTFRDAIMSYDEGVLMARYLLKNNVTKVSTLVVNDDYGLSGANGLKDEFTRLGGAIVSQELFDNSATDMRTQITKIKERNPEAVFLVGREMNIVLSVKQMSEIGITADRIYSVDSLESPTVFTGLGESANNIRFTSVYYDSSDTETRLFFDKFKQKYGSEPGIYAIDAYAAGQYFSQSFLTCGITVEDINRCLSNERFQTIKGELNFNELHDAKINVGVFRINNGTKEFIERVN